MLYFSRVSVIESEDESFSGESDEDESGEEEEEEKDDDESEKKEYELEEDDELVDAVKNNMSLGENTFTNGSHNNSNNISLSTAKSELDDR